MKFSLPALALLATLTLSVSVRASEPTNYQRWIDYRRSLAIPLSSEEVAQGERLFKTLQEANAEYQDTTQKWRAAGKAADEAPAIQKSALQKKADAEWKLSGNALKKYSAASEAFDNFKADKRSRLPLSVCQTMPKTATTLYAGRFPMGAGGQPMLVHLWTSARKAPEGSNYAFEEAPFNLDVFGKINGKTDRWLYITRTTYKGDSYPDADQVWLRWLRPSTSQGPVLVLISPVYMATRFTIVTYPGGIEKGKNSHGYVQEFSQGGVGGGKIVYDFGVDKRGMMTVLEKSWYANGPASTTVLAWNGQRYAATPSPR